MCTLEQGRAFIDLEANGFEAVLLPIGDKTPIPGLLLFADEGHTKLLLLRGDGKTVDLLEVYHAAEDCTRNWHKGSPKWMPHFVGDFKRLTVLCKALLGKAP